MKNSVSSSPPAGHPSTAEAFRLRSDVRYRLVDQQALVLRQSQAEVLGLDEVGSRILDLAGRQTPIEELVAVLAAEYEVDPLRLERDVLAFLAELETHGILERVGTSRT